MKWIRVRRLCIALVAGVVVTPLANAADEAQDKTVPSASAPSGKAPPEITDKAPADTGKPAGKERTRISEEEARKAALASVPDSTVRKARTTIYFGKPVWSIDLKPEKSTRLVNVQVDAYTGRLVSKRLLPPGAAGGRDKTPTKVDLAP